MTEAMAAAGVPKAPGAAEQTGIPQPPKKSAAAWAMDLLLWGGVAVVLILSFGPVDMRRLPLLFTNSENMQLYGRDLLRPDFTNIRQLIGQMWLTIQIALWGTCIAVFLAIPLGLMAARNIAPDWSCGLSGG